MEDRFRIPEGDAPQFFGAEALPSYCCRNRRSPWRSRRGRISIIDVQQKLGPAAKGFGKRPLAGFGEGLDFAIKFLRNLNLRLCHAGRYM